MTKYEYYLIKLKKAEIDNNDQGVVVLRYVDGRCLNEIINYLGKNKITYVVSIHYNKYYLNFDKTCPYFDMKGRY
jgi:hypothetical protein